MKLFEKKNIFKLVLIFLILIIWLLCDIFLSKSIFKNSQFGCFNYEVDYYDLKPNCYSKEQLVKTANFYNVFTDTNGYRYFSKDRKKNKKDSIVILGDSMIYGVGMNYENTFAGLLSETKKNFEVYNLAVPSYSPTTHLYRLKKFLKKNDPPKKIVLFLDVNDLSDEASRWKKNPNIERPIIMNNLLGNNKKVYKNKWKEFKHENFKGTRTLINLINNQLRILKIKYLKFVQTNYTEVGITKQGDFTFTEVDKLDKRYWEPVGIEGGLQKIKDNVKQISNISKEINSEFYIGIYPWAVTLEYGQDVFNWENFGKELCDQISNCLNYINLFTDFKLKKETSINWSTDLFFLHDVHMNKNSQSIILKRVLKDIF